MNNKTAVLIGATGLVGSQLLEVLKSDPDIATIKMLVRRPVSYQHPKIKSVVINFSEEEAFRSAMHGSDLVFCAVGTTNKKVNGDKTEYRKVDYDIPVNAAKFGLEAGCSPFALVSSLGANSSSSNFYLKLKGEVEDAVRSIDIPSTLIFRPSFLLGKREESRLGERMGILLMKPLSFLIPPNMRPISAHQLAKAMVEATKIDQKGHKVFHYKEMMALISDQ